MSLGKKLVQIAFILNVRGKKLDTGLLTTTQTRIALQTFQIIPEFIVLVFTVVRANQ